MSRANHHKIKAARRADREMRKSYTPAPTGVLKRRERNKYFDFFTKAKVDDLETAE